MNHIDKLSLIMLLAIIMPLISYAQENNTDDKAQVEPIATQEAQQQSSELEKELAKKVQELKALAAANNAEAQYNLGMFYLDGLNGVEKNYSSAIELIEKSALQGNLDAQLALAEIYSFQVYDEAAGKRNEAFKWYKMAAAQEHPGAMHNYAMLLLPDAKTNQDLETIIQWLSKAAYKGQNDSQYNLGVIYSRQLNWEKAFYWFKAAAKGGNSAAQFRTGVLYYKGLGTKRNDKQAKYWLNLAANHDNQAAKEFLASAKLQ